MKRVQRRDDPEMTLRALMRGMKQGFWTAAPAIVEAVDLDRQTVTVQPTIKEQIALDDGTLTSVPLPLLPDVPIVFPAGGGYSLTFPIQPGDECLVVFADRCIDAWWQSGGVQEQADQRMHDLSDGIAIFGPRSQPRKLSGVSAEAVQLRSDDGTAGVEISSSGITLTHPAAVTINAPATTIAGTLAVSGAITAPAGATIGGVPFNSHKHTNVQPGSGTSGGPTA